MDITEEMYKAAKKLADDWKDHVEPNAAFDRFTLAHARAVVEQYEREQAKRCGSIVVGYDEGTADDTAYREPRCWMPNCNGTCKHAQADETAAPPAPLPSEPAMPATRAFHDKWFECPMERYRNIVPSRSHDLYEAVAADIRAAVADKEREARVEFRKVYERLSNALPNGTFGENVVGVACRELQQIAGLRAQVADLQTALTLERERADKNAADAADKEREVERLKAENERLGKMTKRSFGEESALEDVIRFEMEPGVRSNERPAAKASRIMRLQKSSIASLETAVALERERADKNAADAADMARLREIWTANRWIEDSVERDAILSSNKKVRG